VPPSSPRPAQGPAATRYLAALRQVHGMDFLHANATAGVWGGCVFLTTPPTGCWACLQHHRLDETVPVPPADPAGPIHPPGCASPTFTGTGPDLATIAHHASRVAIHYLLHHRNNSTQEATGSKANDPPQPTTCKATGSTTGLGGDLYVANLRNPDGAPHPVAWHTAQVPVHPDCPLHQPAPAQT
jgi:hypothetical protein